MNQWQQLLIVICGLALLKPTIALLNRLHLLPLALYFFVTRLCFPKWYAANRRICAIIFAGTVLFFAAAWLISLIRHKREEQRIINELMQNGRWIYSPDDLLDCKNTSHREKYF